MDRLEEWRIFVEVARRQSFAQAARALRKSPQAVTRAVAALESRMRTRLLHRTTRSVSLTGDGTEYLERAHRALLEVEALEAPVDRDPELRGTLAITAPVLFGQLHVVPVVAEFLVAHAALAIRLDLVDAVISLADHRIDVGVRIGALPDSSLKARVVGRVRSILCASPAYLSRAGTPRQPEDLARHACIAFIGTAADPSRWLFPGDGTRMRAVTVRPRLVVNTGQAAIDAALLGLGITRLYSYQADPLIARERLRVVLARHEPPPLPIQLVQLPGVPGRAAGAFLDFATTALAKRLVA